MTIPRSQAGYVRFGPEGRVGVMVRSLLIFNIALFAAQGLVSRFAPAVAVDQGHAFVGLVDWWLGLWPARVMHGAVWQLVTYAFLHGSLSHIFWNMVGLWMFGTELERAWGPGRFLRHYLLCALGSSILISVLALLFPSAGYTLGASGAVYGIAMAYGLTWPDRRMLVFFVIPMRMITLVWAWVAISLYFSIAGSADGISHVGHLGGLATGWILTRKLWQVGRVWRDLRYRWAKRKFKVVEMDKDPFWH